jgi:hypothetical protein
MKREKLVVFDFDDTIYARALYKSPISGYLKKAPITELADRAFLETFLRILIESGINVGVASFGKKNLIIDCMNRLYPCDPPYFHGENVITGPDVRLKWIAKLKEVSITFQRYLKTYQTEEEAFTVFSEEIHPETKAQYFCIKLDGSAKVDMIDQISAYYERTGCDSISHSETRFFDDDEENVKAALDSGVLAHLVPRPGFTEDWWKSECAK